MYIPDNATFYQVADDYDLALLDDHLAHGYEERRDFRKAIDALLNRWENRIGECIGERHGFVRLRFHDCPGGVTEEAWLPLYLVTQVPRPAWIVNEPDPDPIEQELDEALGIDW